MYLKLLPCSTPFEGKYKGKCKCKDKCFLPFEVAGWFPCILTAKLDSKYE